jgi:hypothetical protein
MRLYKLLPAGLAFDNIKKKRLKISVLETLNDPWDHRCVRFREPWQKLAWEQMLSGLSQLSGIVCLSKSWTNPVIWSHYATNHEGIALGFDVKEMGADGEPLFLEVDYRSTLVDFELNDKFMRTVIATKFDSWNYEEEVRYFATLTDPDVENKHFFMDFGPNFALREIIFGARYRNPEEMAAILSIARGDPELDCWRATLGETNFKLIRDQNWTYQKN